MQGRLLQQEQTTPARCGAIMTMALGATIWSALEGPLTKVLSRICGSLISIPASAASSAAYSSFMFPLPASTCYMLAKTNTLAQAIRAIEQELPAQSQAYLP